MYIVEKRSQKDAGKLRLFRSVSKTLFKQFFISVARRWGDDGAFRRNVDLGKEWQDILSRKVDPGVVPRIVWVWSVFRFHMGEQKEKISCFEKKRILFCFQNPLPAENIMQTERHMVGNETGVSLFCRLLHAHITYAQRRRFVLRINVYAVVYFVCICSIKNFF